MELACGCFKAKPTPQEISNLEQEGEVGRLLPKPTETNSQLGALSKQDDFQCGWLVLSAAYLLPATLWVALEVIERYFIEGLDDPVEKWSFRLPFLGTSKLRVCCMGLHFICGSVLTLSGVWQVLPYSKRPELRWSHRLVGIFVLCAVLTALGGFTFIVQQTMLAGGYPMTVSFGIYGVSLVVCAVLAYWKAIEKDLESHRRWGLRAFAMGIASFEYRVFLYAGIKFGFTVSTEQNCEPLADGSVPFFRDQYYNQFIAWFFFVGNWIFVEWYLRASNSKLQQAILWIFIVLATIMMILYTYWGIERLTASD